MGRSGDLDIGQALGVDQVTAGRQAADVGIHLTGGKRLQRIECGRHNLEPNPGKLPSQQFMHDISLLDRDKLAPKLIYM